MPVQPTREQLAELGAIAGTDADGPVIMLNLNHYRERAVYEIDPPGARIPTSAAARPTRATRRSPWRRCGASAAGSSWHAQSPGLVIGDEANRCDEVLAVRYPSVKAFLELALDPEIMVALAHRSAGLERATIIRCEAGLGD